ncbi:MAG: hypothetical protein LBH93_04110 [Chitinispirillales bacterium]|nr:hypothetical protein [Chitinispirillales bacterium]
MSIKNALGRVVVVALPVAITVVILAGCNKNVTVTKDTTAAESVTATKDVAVTGNTAVTAAKTVTINGLTWMTQNLNIETQNSWCYDDDPDDCATYGRLYTWEAAKSACASMGGNWRLSTNEDWDNLVKHAGGKNVAGKKLKSKRGWEDGGNGTDDYGFSALPGGGAADESFGSAGYSGNWWSATAAGPDGALFRSILDEGDSVETSAYFRGSAFSARCVAQN